MSVKLISPLLDDRAARKQKKLLEVIALVEKTQNPAFLVLTFILLTGIEVAFLWAVFLGKPVDAGLSAAITIIAVLPIVVIRAFDISVLKFGKEGFEAEMVRTEIVGEVLSEVDQLFVRTMSESICARLQLLDGNEPVDYVLDDALQRQVYYLENLGYIEVSPELSLHDSGADLRSRIKVTNSGRNFLDLRRRVLQPKVTTA
jgi:hypothetical protein